MERAQLETTMDTQIRECRTESKNKISPTKVSGNLFDGDLSIFTLGRFAYNTYDGFCVAKAHVYPVVIPFYLDTINGQDILAFGLLQCSEFCELVLDRLLLVSREFKLLFDDLVHLKASQQLL